MLVSSLFVQNTRTHKHREYIWLFGLLFYPCGHRVHTYTNTRQVLYREIIDFFGAAVVALFIFVGSERVCGVRCMQLLFLRRKFEEDTHSSTQNTMQCISHFYESAQHTLFYMYKMQNLEMAWMLDCVTLCECALARIFSRPPKNELVYSVSKMIVFITWKCKRKLIENEMHEIRVWSVCCTCPASDCRWQLVNAFKLYIYPHAHSPDLNGKYSWLNQNWVYMLSFRDSIGWWFCFCCSCFFQWSRCSNNPNQKIK